MRRAKNLDDKALRFQQILDSARALHHQFKRLPTAAELATETGLGKGTLYLYFRSREAIFLTLLEADIKQWLSSIQQLGNPALPFEQTMKMLIDRIASDQDTCRLAALSHGLIENSDDLDAITKYKGAIAVAVTECADSIARRTQHSASDIQRLLQASYALMMGLWQAANPPAVVRAMPKAGTLQEPDFVTTSKQALLSLWQGWLLKPN
ncbi:TetR/AcrR family transcriptional regulator [Gallaecimonas mangrovi]|uniref:TetR/AcrR family transcriptional regulator n=1 Tax=Gallaecimonas mangrovi TaxID=2291597 RepID=UPI000E1FDF5C|nr:TetR/AcrR family transcriptional regulator [Gallaecimonas mangrovi]